MSSKSNNVPADYNRESSAVPAQEPGSLPNPTYPPPNVSEGGKTFPTFVFPPFRHSRSPPPMSYDNWRDGSTPMPARPPSPTLPRLFRLRECRRSSEHHKPESGIDMDVNMTNSHARANDQATQLPWVDVVSRILPKDSPSPFPHTPQTQHQGPQARDATENSLLNQPPMHGNASGEAPRCVGAGQLSSRK